MTTATISPKVAAQAESVSLQDIVTRNMKVAMTLRNVKQKDLANALGVDRSSISQKMTRRVAWSLEDIEKHWKNGGKPANLGKQSAKI